jgi:quercetin dioxygenase-like cupin family protein
LVPPQGFRKNYNKSFFYAIKNYENGACCAKNNIILIFSGGSVMVKKRDNEGIVAMSEGVQRQTLVYGERMHLLRFVLKSGSRVPSHSHPHEQTGHLLEGRMRLTIEGSMHDLEEGDSWNISGGIPHEAEAMEDSVVIEIFSPVREDYL